MITVLGRLQHEDCPESEARVGLSESQDHLSYNGAGVGRQVRKEKRNGDKNKIDCWFMVSCICLQTCELPWGEDDRELSRQLGTHGSFVLSVFFFPFCLFLETHFLCVTALDALELTL